jgi:hypothetical protein
VLVPPAGSSRSRCRPRLVLPAPSVPRLTGYEANPIKATPDGRHQCPVRQTMR